MQSALLLAVLALLILSATPFVLQQHPSTTGTTSSRRRTSSNLPVLNAAAKKKKKRSNSGGGFGGASMEPCPCGSSETYSSCCGKLHKDINAYKSATAEQVVRARYAAYAKKQADFLMASTHPFQKDFDPDLKRWKETIKKNMYDNFDLPVCKILEQNEGETKATVQFVAELVLRETGEVTSFMETSEFERAQTDKRWLYLNGTIEEVPDTLLQNIETN